MRTMIIIATLFITPNLWAEAHVQPLSELRSDHYNAFGLKNHFLKRVTHKKQALIIIPGMSEPAAKYWEVYKDLKDLKYDIYIWDHIGQGKSDYITGGIHPQKVHIDDYESYIRSLKAFLRATKSRYQSIDILAHSMGAHIIAQILSRDSYLVNKVILNAPMIHLKLGMPYWLGRLVLRSFYSSDDWAPFQETYRFRGVEESGVSQSVKRIDEYHRLLLDHPELQRGGITSGWILASLKSIDWLKNFDQWHKVKNPILMLLAGKDVFIENKPAQKICRKLKNCRSHIFNDSKHEILSEKDEIRKKALNKIRAFLKN